MFTYGIKVETSEDEVSLFDIRCASHYLIISSQLIAVTEEAIDQAIAVAYPGATFVDTFPIRTSPTRSFGPEPHSPATHLVCLTRSQ